jgi:hypothetical protein
VLTPCSPFYDAPLLRRVLPIPPDQAQDTRVLVKRLAPNDLEHDGDMLRVRLARCRGIRPRDIRPADQAPRVLPCISGAVLATHRDPPFHWNEVTLSRGERQSMYKHAPGRCIIRKRDYDELGPWRTYHQTVILVGLRKKQEAIGVDVERHPRVGTGLIAMGILASAGVRGARSPLRPPAQTLPALLGRTSS